MAGLASRLRAISSSAGLDVDNLIPLTKAQLALMTEFYAIPKSHINLVKHERDLIFETYKRNRSSEIDENYKNKFPALQAEIDKSLKSGKLIQSAIFSECVYAQTLANHFQLKEYTDYALNPMWLSPEILALLNSYSLKARYIYRNSEGTRILVQAGGPGGIDSALISVMDTNVFTIEFKESLAKVSEADLPRYGEDGLLVKDEKFSNTWTQFMSMVEEQLAKRLNFFDHIGSNINDFSHESIQEAISDNYTGKKFADVICTEDNSGFLTMLPSNQAYIWGSLQGEIRPSGRNSYVVWTTDRLKMEIESRGGVTVGEKIRIQLSSLTTSAPRGGTGISRYKINSLFFVRAKDVKLDGDWVEFSLKHVRQNKPTISAKMDFKGISFDEVRNYYIGIKE
jgi:hypothetical protein